MAVPTWTTEPAAGRRSARVVVAGISAHDARRVAAAITGDGGRATDSTIDVAREQDVQRLVEDTAATYGHLDYLFNNAGIAIGGDARYLTLDHWRRVLDVDLYGVLHGVVAAYPVMVSQGFGHIVNTSSSAAFFPASIRWARRAYHLSPASSAANCCGSSANGSRGTGQPHPWPVNLTTPRNDEFALARPAPHFRRPSDRAQPPHLATFVLCYLPPVFGAGEDASLGGAGGAAAVRPSRRR
jgi:short chain dehydrogenase